MGLLTKFKVPVPKGRVARSVEEAVEASKIFGKGPDSAVVVKAQVLAGGRGKGRFDNGYQGGVKLCRGTTEVEAATRGMLGHRLITKQTGADGKPCNSVYICETLVPKHEYYFAIMLDRQSRGPVLVGSAQGGMDIEAVAARTPEAIVKHAIGDISRSDLSESETTEFAKRMGFDASTARAAAEAMRAMYRLFRNTDATLIEINPMAVLQDNSVVCMDCKINIDDNADFRQAEIFAQRDVSQEDPREVAAAAARLSYIGLDGEIGCLVNGAGLAMATMDLIKLHGGEPANFLDVGGSATSQQVSEAFRIITSDTRVRSILVNIFGGIMRCDTIAQGVIDSARTLKLKVPLVVRLQGTMVDRARQMLRESGLAIHAEDDLDAAARLAVKLAGSDPSTPSH